MNKSKTSLTSFFSSSSCVILLQYFRHPVVCVKEEIFMIADGVRIYQSSNMLQALEQNHTNIFYLPSSLQPAVSESLRL